MTITIDTLREIVRPACAEFGVKRLAAFGSVARGEAGATSDVDLLVEFADPDERPARRFFGLLHRLEDTLDCPVDLLTANSLRNPFFRRQALAESVSVYEA